MFRNNALGVSALIYQKNWGVKKFAIFDGMVGILSSQYKQLMCDTWEYCKEAITLRNQVSAIFDETWVYWNQAL